MISLPTLWVAGLTFTLIATVAAVRAVTIRRPRPNRRRHRLGKLLGVANSLWCGLDRGGCGRTGSAARPWVQE